MKLTILGCNGPVQGAGGACSSYLVQSETTNILVDMGNGSLGELRKYALIEEIHAIILSHLHYDHISDLFVMKYAIDIMRSRGESAKRQTLFLPGSPGEIAGMVTTGDTFDTIFIADGGKHRIGDMDIGFQKVCHPVESYAVSLSAEGKRLVYSGDTNAKADFGDFVGGADLFLADGGLLERHGGEDAPHMTVSQACRAGEAAKRTVLTHLSPFYTLDEIRREMTGNSMLARPEMVIRL